MKKIIPDFIIDADNVYRTRRYIIKQVLSLETPAIEDNGIMSYDTFIEGHQLEINNMSLYLVIEKESMENDFQAQCTQENI